MQKGRIGRGVKRALAFVLAALLWAEGTLGSVCAAETIQSEETVSKNTTQVEESISENTAEPELPEEESASREAEEKTVQAEESVSENTP
ncbi:MAG: hypothetical protein NC302_13460, partial [Bacteroidales bacterium]|nr:hypothetical protein [Bacteroidales bacterium]